jgi:uncharacterized protein YdgA (DUF945 family)
VRKAITISAVVLAVLGGGLVSFSAWSGGAVVAQLEQRADELKKLSPNVKIVKQTVERGLFRSTHQVTVQLGCVPAAALDALATSSFDPHPAQPGAAPSGAPPKAGPPIELSIRSVVLHGPLPGLRGVGAASIDSELLVPEAYKTQLQKLIGKQPIVRVHSTIGFGRDLVSDFTLAGVQYAHPQQGSFSSKPLQGRLMGKLPDKPTDASTMLLDIPSMEVSSRGPDGTNVLLKVGRTLSETKVEPRVDPKLWLSPVKSSGVITSIDLSGSPGSSGGTALPTLRAHSDSIKFSSESTLVQGLWSTHSKFSAKGKVNDVSLDKLELSSSLERVHAATYQHLLRTLFDTVLSCEQPGPESIDRLLPALQKDVGALLVYNPEYALDKLAIELLGKRAELSYSAGTRGVTAADATLPVPLLLATKGFVRGQLRVHTGLIEEIAHKVVSYDAPPGTATGVSPQTRSFVNGMIDQFATLGYLAREGDDVVASASIESGQVLLNGKPMALPDLPLPGGP